MRDEPDNEGEEALLDLMRGRFLLGLVDQLQNAYPNAGSGHVEDAVAEAVSKLVVRLRKDPPVRDVSAYLAKVAFNTLKKGSAQRADREAPLDERRDRPTPSAEDDALRAAAVSAITAEVRSWENANIREVMLVCVEAIALGEPIEADEIAELVSVTLGEEISPGSVRVWKMRGLRRLQEFVQREAISDPRHGVEEEES